MRALLAALAIALIAPVLSPTTADAAPRPGFDWPLSPRPEVARRFEAPAFKYGRGHRGVDLAGNPGQQVLAAGPGVVAFAGQVAGRGVVSIDHDGGLRTTYEPVEGSVRVGDPVVAGTPIGALNPGHLECGQPACLHWGLRRGEDYLDPLTLLRPVAVRLKPVDLKPVGAPGRAPPAAAPR